MTARARAAWAAGLLLMACHPPALRIGVAFPGPVDLSAGDEVRYQGVRVGHVEEVTLRQPSPSEPAQVVLSLAIEAPGITLRQADVFETATDGLLGERYLRVTPAPGPSPPLAPGATVAGRPPISTRLRESTESALDALGELAKKKRDELLDALEGEAEPPAGAE